VGIGAGGPHIADESWELDRSRDLVSWVESLSGVWTPEVWTSEV
jgi:hypothetical protein